MSLKKVIGLLEEAAGLPNLGLAPTDKGDGSITIDSFTDEVIGNIRKGIAAKIAKAGEDAVSKAPSFDDGFKKGQAISLDKYEDELRGEVGIEEKVRGKQLRELLKTKLAEAKEEKSPGKDAIEKSKFHLDEMERLKADYEAKLKEAADKYAAFEAQVNEAKTFDAVWSAALPIIEECRPAFSDSESVKAFQWDSIKAGIRDGRRFEVQDKRIVVLDKDGKVMKDDMGNPLDFKPLVTGVVNARVGTLASDKRSGAGANGQGTGKAAWKGRPIKTDDDLTAVLSDPDLSYEEKQAAVEQYGK